MLAYFLLGLIVGSFLNVLVLRYGKKGIGGRSVCMRCGTTLRAIDLVPVISWIFLKGRCRYCGSSISIQYPLVELSTGIAFALLGGAPIEFIFKAAGLPIAALLIAIAVHDLRTTIIPDGWIVVLGILTLVTVALSAYMLDGEYVLPLAAGPLAALPLFSIWFISKGQWMGLGDPKLALSIGWLLGFPGGINAVILAFVVGAIIMLPLLFFSSATWSRIRAFIPIAAFRKRQLSLTMKSEVPFGPFLVVACFIVWFSHMYGVVIPFVWQ